MQTANWYEAFKMKKKESNNTLTILVFVLIAVSVLSALILIQSIAPTIQAPPSTATGIVTVDVPARPTVTSGEVTLVVPPA